jgi:8-oxo-dGTP diphosphatase
MQEYIPPTLVVDAVIFRVIDNRLHVLLIQRAKEPFKGVWALPGGYNPRGETTSEAFKRILLAKAGIKEEQLSFTEQLYTFDTVARDPRGHAVSITYMGLTRDAESVTSPSTQEPTFFAVEELPTLAYDHKDIIAYALERLRSKISYTAAAAALLPKLFTLTELQATYEAVLGHELDKRNFRKRFLAFGSLSATEKFTKNGAHRPARLYTFVHDPSAPLTKSFE